MTTMKTYSCPKHGNQGGFIGVEVVLTSHGAPLPESLQSRASRRYCMACWIDLMDREMEQLAAVEVIAETTDGGEGKYVDWALGREWVEKAANG